jgi:molecular chaperone DnaK (HSP70)
VARPDFENWIEPYLEQIAGCFDRLLKPVALNRDAIDSVFLTGGSSFVPAVRRIFTERFGADRTGDEFTASRAASRCAPSTPPTRYTAPEVLFRKKYYPLLTVRRTGLYVGAIICGIGPASILRNGNQRAPRVTV